MRDHWADCQVTLPALLEEGNRAALLFYRASLTAMRRQLFPDLVEALDRWREGRDERILLETVDRGRAHWEKTAKRLLHAGRQTQTPAPKLTDLLEASTL